MHARIVVCAKQIKKILKIGHGGLKFSSAIEVLLRTLHGLHGFWRQKTCLTPSDRQQYQKELILSIYYLILCNIPWNLEMKPLIHSQWFHSSPDLCLFPGLMFVP